MNTFHRASMMVIMLLSGISLLINSCSGKSSLMETFGENYTKAISYIDSNEWISDSLSKAGINPCFALSVVFPEIMRYSEIRDKIETRALLSLYVQYGRDYSDFSIGHFQIKPSFAEALEKEYINLSVPGNNQLMVFDTSATESARKARIERLISQEGQVEYLATFVKIMLNRTAEMSFRSESDRVKLFAAAYNYGFQSGIPKIIKASEKKTFYTGIIPTGVKLNYSEIAVEYFLNCQ